MLGNNNSLPFSTLTGVSNVSQGAVPDKILDDYTGAVGAYGLRLLRKAYSGNCIQVSTAESGGTTAEIGFDSYSLGVDTVAIKTFADANGGVAYVSIWYDQSGSGSSIGNLTGAGTLGENRIIYSDGAVHTDANGKPIIDMYYYSSYFQLGSDQTFDNFHISMLYGYHVSATNGGNILTDSNNEFVTTYASVSTGSTWNIRGSGGSNAPFGPDMGEYSINDPILLNVGTNGDTMNTAWSTSAGIGTSDSVSSWGASETFTLRYLGYTGHSIEFLQEFIIWDADKYSSRTGILTNQNNYFGIY